MTMTTITILPGARYHHIFEGNIHPEEIKMLIDNFWEDMDQFEDTVNIIWDFRDSHSDTFSFESIEFIASKVDDLSDRVRPGRTALLVNDMPEKHLVTYLLSLIGRSSKRQNKMFLDIEEAKNYIGEDYAAHSVS